MLNYLQINTPEMQRLSLAIYRHLANGAPVDSHDLAAELRVPQGQVKKILAEFPTCQFEFDPEDRIVAFCGLSIVTAKHWITINGRQLFTWCAFDPFFLAPLLENLIGLHTVCPQTGRSIALAISPMGVHQPVPCDVVMSIVDPDPAACRENLRQVFCNHVSLFADVEAYKKWAKQKEVVSRYLNLNQVFDLALERNRLRYPSIWAVVTVRR